MTFTQKSAQILSVYLIKSSQIGETIIISTHIKKDNITSTPEFLLSFSSKPYSSPKGAITFNIINLISLFWIFHINGIKQYAALVTFFFQLAYRCQGSSMLWHVLVIIHSYCQIISPCMDIPKYLYPFISWWRFQLFLLCGGYE